MGQGAKGKGDKGTRESGGGSRGKGGTGEWEGERGVWEMGWRGRAVWRGGAGPDPHSGHRQGRQHSRSAGRGPPYSLTAIGLRRSALFAIRIRNS